MLKNNRNYLKVATYSRMKVFFHVAKFRHWSMSTRIHVRSKQRNWTVNTKPFHFRIFQTKKLTTKSDLNQNKNLKMGHQTSRRNIMVPRKWWCGLVDGKTCCFKLHQKIQSFAARNWISSHIASGFAERFYVQFDFPHHLLLTLWMHDAAQWGARACLMLDMIQRCCMFLATIWSSAVIVSDD